MLQPHLKGAALGLAPIACAASCDRSSTASDASKVEVGSIGSVRGGALGLLGEMLAEGDETHATSSVITAPNEASLAIVVAADSSGADSPVVLSPQMNERKGKSSYRGIHNLTRKRLPFPCNA